MTGINKKYKIELTKKHLELIEDALNAYLGTIQAVVSYDDMVYYTGLEQDIYDQFPEGWND